MNQLAPVSIAQSNDNEDAKVFADFEAIFDCANKTFFDGQLDCPVFSFSRNPRLKGAFLAERYVSVEGKCAHGIVLNSDYARGVGDAATMALIGFLLAQMARFDLGPEGKNGSRGTPGYVDGWTRNLLFSMGLTPFAEDEDRQLGYGLSVAAEDDGAFDLMCREKIVEGFAIRWHERPATQSGEAEAAAPETTPKTPTRARFECEDCGTKAWASPKVHLLCGCNGRPLICATEKGTIDE